MNPSTRWCVSFTGGVSLVVVAIAFITYAVWFAIAVGVVVIVGESFRQFVKWTHSPPTPADRYCARADARLDELAARRNTAPHGNCQVIYGPWVREEPTLPPTVGPFDRSGGAA